MCIDTVFKYKQHGFDNAPALLDKLLAHHGSSAALGRANDDVGKLVSACVHHQPRSCTAVILFNALLSLEFAPAVDGEIANTLKEIVGAMERANLCNDDLPAYLRSADSGTVFKNSGAQGVVAHWSGARLRRAPRRKAKNAGSTPVKRNATKPGKCRDCGATETPKRYRGRCLQCHRTHNNALAKKSRAKRKKRKEASLRRGV